MLPHPPAVVPPCTCHTSVARSSALLGLFVSHQEYGTCQSKSFLTCQCLPFSDFCQQNGLAASKMGWDTMGEAGSQMLYYVQLTREELHFSLLRGLVPPFLLLLCVVLGTEVWGSKVNCFLAKCILADVMFKICHVWWLTWSSLLLWCSSNELLFHCLTEYFGFHVFLLNLLKKSAWDDGLTRTLKFCENFQIGAYWIFTLVQQLCCSLKYRWMKTPFGKTPGQRSRADAGRQCSSTL